MRISGLLSFSSVLLFILSAGTVYGISFKDIYNKFKTEPKIFERVCLNPENYSLDQQRMVEKVLHEVRGNDTSESDCNKLWKKAKILKKLDFSDFNIRDISVLQNFKKLEELVLKNNYISDLSPLNHLRTLRILDVSDNCLRDLSFIDAKKIESLDIRQNLIPPADVKILADKMNPGQIISMEPQYEEKLHCGIMEGQSSAKTHQPSGSDPSYSSSGNLSEQTSSGRRTLPENPDSWNEERVHRTDDVEESSVSSGVDESEKELSSSPVIDSLLQQLRHQGVKLTDVIMLEDIQNSKDLFAALEGLGLSGCTEDTVIQSLFTFSGLLEDLAFNEGGAPIRPFENIGKVSVNDALKKYKLNRRILHHRSDTKSFSHLLKELDLDGGFDPDFYVKFYHLMTGSASVLRMAVYPGGDEGRGLAHKKSDLIQLLASVKRYENGSAAARQLSRTVVAGEPERFTSEGQSDNWFAELQYKLYILYQNYGWLSQDKKATLISYLLHGGRNCSDAKWNAIRDAFNAYCPEAANALKEQAGSPQLQRDVDDVIIRNVNSLKRDYLGRYLNSYVDSRPRYKDEACTYYNTTWDALAPTLGLGSVGSRYSTFLMTEAVRNFDPEFYQMMTPSLVYKATSDELGSLLKRHYLGVLSQLIPDQDYLILALLRYYQVIY